MNFFSRGFKLQAENACKEFLSDSELNNFTLVKSIQKDMFRCYRLCKAKPYEYFLFGLRYKTDAEIKNYITDSSMMELLSKTGKRHLHNIELNEKCNFYRIAAKWFKRDVALIESPKDINVFLEFVKTHKKVVVKAASVGCGSGISIVEYTTDAQIKNTFDEMLSKGSRYIVEEIIIQGHHMASWNASSVNTLRINTYKNRKGVFNHVCFIRTGRPGSFVDNGGQGGIFAIIDDITGQICSNGYDEKGREYEFHPNSGIKYVGWQVPQWNKVLSLAKSIHNDVFEDHPYIGWDFALNNQNEWVLIEGNWGQFVCQQMCLKRGVKNEIKNLLKG